VDNFADNYVDDYAYTLTTDNADPEAVPAGLMEFQVADIERMRSKAGNPMVKLSLRVTLPSGGVGWLTDYVTLTSAAEWKLVQLFTAVGMKRKGEPLTIDWQGLIGKTGLLETKMEVSDQYGERAKVHAYIDPESDRYDVFYDKKAEKAQEAAATPQATFVPGQF